MSSDLEPWIVCVVLLFGPLVGGFLLGRGLRRLNPPAWTGAILFCLSPALGLAADWIPLGLWNLAGVGVGCAAGIWVGLADEVSPGGLTFMTILMMVGVAGLELWARSQGHSPELSMGFPALVQPTMRAAIVRGEAPRRWSGPTALAANFGARPYILHVGDSMIASGRFSSQLDESIPAFVHVNLGMPGTGPDIQFIELFRWLDAAPRQPALVVHHLFTGNDVDDIDQDYGFCANHMVVEYEADGVHPCRDMQWQFSLRDLVTQAPPPYLLWVAAKYLAVAAQALDGVREMHIATAPHWPAVEHGDVAADWELHWSHFEALMKSERDELRRRGVDLVASVLPFRGALESATPSSTLGWKVKVRMLEVLARLQIPAMDAWPPLYDAVKRDGSQTWFKAAPDVHFNDRGFDIYDAWLAQQLAPLIPDASARQ